MSYLADLAQERELAIEVTFRLGGIPKDVRRLLVRAMNQIEQEMLSSIRHGFEVSHADWLNTPAI